MALVRFDDADAAFDMNGPNARFQSTAAGSSTTWNFNIGEDETAVAFGRDLRYDINARPTQGTIDELQIRLDGAASNDATVSGLSVQATALKSADNFWDVILAGNDVIDTQGLDERSVGDGVSVIFGDSAVARGGVNGGDDTFKVGNTSLTLAGDALFLGDNLGSNGASTKAIVYFGGHDRISGDVAARQTFYGDVLQVTGSATLAGGNDVIAIASTSEGQAYGDAGTVAGISAEIIATVNGGNDEVKGFVTDATLLLSGDVGTLFDFARVVGGNDSITGARGGDFIAGDVMFTEGQLETRIIGGDDRIDGGLGNDVIAGESLGTLGDQLRRLNDGDFTKTKIAGGDDTILGGDGDDTIYGELRIVNDKELKILSSGNDVLDGGEGNDALLGQTGNDRLTGGLGRDILEGGSGADVFVFTALNESPSRKGADTVSDFSRKQGDRIDLSSLDDKERSFEFAGRADTIGDGEIGFVRKQGDTLLVGDGFGRGQDDFVIRFDGIINFREGDFIL